MPVPNHLLLGHLRNIKPRRRHQRRRVDGATDTRQDGCAGVDRPQALPNLEGLGGGDQIELVEHDHVGEHQLLERLVGGLALLLLLAHLPQPLQDILGVAQRHNPRQRKLRGDGRRLQQRAHYGHRVGHSGGLDQHRIQRLSRLDCREDGREGAQYIPPDRTAHAPVIEQRRLARAEEARQHRDWDLAVGALGAAAHDGGRSGGRERPRGLGRRGARGAGDIGDDERRCASPVEDIPHERLWRQHSVAHRVEHQRDARPAGAGLTERCLGRAAELVHSGVGRDTEPQWQRRQPAHVRQPADFHEELDG
eukprot:scaffold12821_cov92-Isochrysis_galbana.AAC.2